MGLCVLYYVEYSLYNVKKVGFFYLGWNYTLSFQVKFSTDSWTIPKQYASNNLMQGHKKKHNYRKNTLMVICSCSIGCPCTSQQLVKALTLYHKIPTFNTSGKESF